MTDTPRAPVKMTAPSFDLACGRFELLTCSAKTWDGYEWDGPQCHRVAVSGGMCQPHATTYEKAGDQWP